VPDPWPVDFASSARRDLVRLDKQDRERIVEALERLAAGDPRSDVKRLQGYREPTFRLRVGELRVIFARDHAARSIQVYAVGPRGGIYR
jgi:mRNA interferase RelE/StbE